MTHPWHHSVADDLPRILVVGDLMLDRTRYVSRRGRDQFHNIVAEEVAVTEQPGGAAYVASLLSHWQCRVTIAGVLGADSEAETLTRQFEDSGMTTFTVTDTSRPTTVKERLICVGNTTPQELLRIDRESTHPLSPQLEQMLSENHFRQTANWDALLISDYAKGLCGERLITNLITSAREKDVPVIVDPARRWCYQRYGGCDVITPNRTEAQLVTGTAIHSVDSAVAAAERIREVSHADACIVTLDAEGAVLVSGNGIREHIPAGDVPVADAIGAGDAFAAAMTFGLLTGQSLCDATGTAVRVAAEQVQRPGTCLVDRDVLRRPAHHRTPICTRGKRLSLIDLESALARLRRQGQTIVLTNGCFDLLHPGHVDYLEQAAAEGDVLVVAVNADLSVSQLKGNSRPVLHENERMRLLSALACVDYVTLFDEPTPHNLIRRLKPDLLVKGGDYAVEDVVGREVVEAYGGSVMTMSLTPGHSTSRIVERLTRSERASVDAG